MLLCERSRASPRSRCEKEVASTGCRPFAAKLRQLHAAVAQIGSSRVYLLPVDRNGDAEKTLSPVMQGALEAELATLAADVEEFLATPPERESTRGGR
jgi:hypothetical protein